jgi:ABC-2 type transport system ATP-binding protein
MTVHAPILEATSLEVRYGRLRALASVSLSVPAGSVYALLGRNGAGKSSFVRCLLGLQKPFGGSGSLLGLDAWKGRDQAMARVGVVPEEPDAPPAMKASEIAAFCARLYPKWNQAGVEARLKRFQVPLGTPVGRLSRGQKAQLSLALALAPDPELLVLDDPTLGLDAVARRAFYEELLSDLADRGTSVFITTHDLAGVEGIADRVGILREGHLELEGSLEELKARFFRIHGRPGLSAEMLAPLAPLSFRANGFGGEAIVSRFDPEVFARLQAEGHVEGEPSSLSLEDLFIAVAGSETGVQP